MTGPMDVYRDHYGDTLGGHDPSPVVAVLRGAVLDLLGVDYDINDQGQCIGCGRDFPGEGVRLCPGDDCPRHLARAVLARTGKAGPVGH